jgi:hypothetical protein
MDYHYCLTTLVINLQGKRAFFEEQAARLIFTPLHKIFVYSRMYDGLKGMFKIRIIENAPC